MQKINKAMENIAREYVWWYSPQEALKNTDYFLLHVMNLATWEDAQKVLAHYGTAPFVHALHDALPGALTEKSWVFWHHWFNLPPKPYPVRKLNQA